MPTIFDLVPEASQSKSNESPADALARIVANLKAIATVLAEYPARNPETWKSPGWAKQLKDLQIACERLHEYARQVEDVSTRLGDGRAEPR
jgi:hypothetical protein